MYINFCRESFVYQEPRLLDCSTNVYKVTTFDSARSEHSLFVLEARNGVQFTQNEGNSLLD